MRSPSSELTSFACLLPFVLELSGKISTCVSTGHRAMTDQAHQHAVVALERGEQFVRAPGSGHRLSCARSCSSTGRRLPVPRPRARSRPCSCPQTPRRAGAAFPGRGATGSHRRSRPPRCAPVSGRLRTAGRTTRAARGTASASVSACGSEDAAAASCAGAVQPGASDDSTARSNDPNKRPNRRGRSDARAGADKCQRFAINESFRFEALTDQTVGR
jgi:hypothetical protein